MAHHPLLRLAAILLLITLPSCSQPKSDKQKPKSLPPAVVVIASAEQRDVPVEIKTFGTLEASEQVTIKAMVSGELTKVGFREGQEVKQGALLFEIDPRTAQAALNKAQASLTRNQVIRDNALQDFHRYSQLASKGLISQEQAEAYRTKAGTAAADVTADQAALENSKAQLAYCTITAPISGRLGELNVDRGNVVKANDTELVTIKTVSPIYANFTIPEDKLLIVKEHLAAGEMEVQAEVPGRAGLTEKGLVSFLDNSVDPTTGSIRLKASFPNEKKQLWPGQFLTLSLSVDVRENAVTVPSEALQTGQKKQFVFIVKKDQTAEVRTVSPGPTYQGMTVIEQGLATGETVIIDGQMRVIPGGKVEIKESNRPNNSAQRKAGQ
ncbi:MAG: efflux RND transporter periplasmic adaptor subunit [Desulfobulbaceae bacterium]|nr:efflux RND transporter periplasmic adaptor subunit [Desulfobulbaceae bacterium]